MKRMAHRWCSSAAVMRTSLILALACGASAQSITNHLARREQTASQAARVVRNGTVLQQKPRILLDYDMEGISSVDRLSMTACNKSDDYARGVSGLVADVNAVIDGLF